MTIGLSLIAYGLALTLAGPRLLSARRASRRAPRLGLLAWGAAISSALAALVAGGLAIAMPALPTRGLGDFSVLYAHALGHTATAPDKLIAHWIGLVLALGITLRAGWCIGRVMIETRRLRSRHARTVHIVGRLMSDVDALLVESDRPMAYCVPGRVRTVVVTSAARDALTPEQLHAVLAHESAHLDGRHHLGPTVARGLARAFPEVPLFRAAVPEIARLVEMCADDAAARRLGPHVVASALATLSRAAAPAETLAAAATATQERLSRLTEARRGVGATRAVLLCWVVALLAGPPLAALAPVVAVVASHVGVHLPGF